jgi:tripartite-type tricarboxylate transporter receptor subunit TctC
MKLNRRRVLQFAGVVSGLVPLSNIAWPQSYPTRPIRFIVSLAPGGGLDFVARLLGEHMARAINQQVFIENKAGAGGMIGAEAAAKSPPDGYTVLITTDVVASAPQVMRMDVAFVKDLVPVIQLIRVPVVLAVHHSLDVGSIAELVRAAKRQPGMGYASSGVGTQQHFVGEWFAHIAGIKLEHVPYRGAGPAINDLIAGHVKIGILGPVALIPHYKAGTLRLLAQSAETRSPILPDVPTFQEGGIKGLVLDAWFGAFLPAGTPPPIVACVNAEFGSALADRAVREKLLQAAFEPVGGSAEQLARVIREDSEKYARLAKQFNIMAN